MRRRRDSQRSRVYAAERAAHGDRLHQGTMTHDEVVALVENLAGELGLVVPHVRHRRSGRRSYGGKLEDGTPYIGLTPSDRNPVMVAHELAHAWLVFESGQRYAFHGPEWCRVYLMLLELTCGPDLATDMVDAFDQYGVDHSSGMDAVRCAA